MQRALVITLDLDGLREYVAQHGLAAEAGQLDASTDLQPRVSPVHMMYGAPLLRFLGVCATSGIDTGTLFVVGRDATEPHVSQRLRELVGHGWEVASHSFAHDYRLCTRPRFIIEEDIAHSVRAIEAATGIAPIGFRAPGYRLSPTLLDVLVEQGFRYDSSTLPSPPYYLARLLALMAYRFTGVASASHAGSPLAAMSRRDCTILSRPRGSLVELPNAVTRRLRLPLVGAALASTPEPLVRKLVASVEGDLAVVVNLHAMDLVDAEADGLPLALARRQPELRIPLAVRQRRIQTALRLLGRGRQVVTAADLADRIIRTQRRA